jgi:hypothetical protein
MGVTAEATDATHRATTDKKCNSSLIRKQGVRATIARLRVSVKCVSFSLSPARLASNSSRGLACDCRLNVKVAVVAVDCGRVVAWLW